MNFEETQVFEEEEGGERLDYGSYLASGEASAVAGEAPRARSRSSSVPNIASAQQAWTEHFDATHGVPYYHNRITNETTWEPPENWLAS